MSATPRSIKIIAILISVVIACVVIWQQLLDPERSAKRLTKKIERGIPVGSTKGSVYEFLETGRFAFSGYDVGPDPLKGLPSESRERKRYITATVRVNGTLPYFSYDYIQIVFYFDEEELLSAYKLQQFYDSP